MKRKVSLFCSALLLLTFLSPASATALEPNSVASVFSRYIENKYLANPSVVVIDQQDGAVVYEKGANSLRKPASIQKIFMGVAAVMHLPMDQVFPTSLWVGTEPNSLVIQGSYDPWISTSAKLAEKMGRTSLPRIEFNSLKALKDLNPDLNSNFTLFYSSLFTPETEHIKKFFRTKGLNVKMKRVSNQTALDFSGTRILGSESPVLEEMLAYAIAWSDNTLSERIARLASVAAGNTFDQAGVADTFSNALAELGIESSKMIIKDASGLSKENRVTANLVGQLLVKIRTDERFVPLINGFPISGISGTLRNRFTETAPDAVGLVKAKTGTLSNTTNLAGYVESGDREYAFVIISDRHVKTYSVASRIRDLVDRILGKIAAPFMPRVQPEPEPVPASELEPELEIASSEIPL
ncbi:D-alanyl-D-alanine carboxypeptidase [Candidatus Planktophila versatilis]|uniref:D-alanyl-D-alanine carboxypeptidase / D-alanyl-D-alanine-endopeptidase (Penicillin-binding protein 4) n=1 Tax=Candidatus Planktophila versatilis TaxID=1884905 RepID=A0ABN5BDB3_9ACTN|nr:D-alanyl-D-alanine carboxypeptidase [Candidatus Planktophila versatilis]ASY17758.1 D-alanyl-D-alanine carboxypeptidase / D-alanyl-D-alanine-endopeptidase (penicillin-binding protein 4) [Candidatus Planktophila versatilis]